ncbi:MFS transporter [Paracoccus aerodenitrificans]|uniref:MFS transporter n=1 Tax=Paracoccus aerodenitrificans TaxID=3017781 RepID=UPI0022F0FD07|nr:MFS transporter [Paracoccus aerodenitrificans]WBU64295.1 MFS transporter [Paracoccus aerodenitrificans]
MSDVPQTRWADLFRAGNAGVMPLLAGGVMLHAVNVFLAVALLPSAVSEIGGLTFFAWATTVFVVTSISAAALGASLLQYSGPARAYLIAGCVFIAGSALCAVAPRMTVLLVGRAIQGFGGGLMVAMSYALIGVMLDRPLWSRAMALISGMWGVGTLLGPGLGGMFAEYGMWRGAFWTLVALGAVFTALSVLRMPSRSRAQTLQPIAWTQLCLLSLAVLALSAASVLPETWQMIAAITSGVLVTAALIAVERRSRRKLLPDGATLPNAVLGRLYLIMMLLAITVTSVDVFVPLFLQVLHGVSPLIAGYMAALIAFGWMAGSVLNADEHGPLKVIAIRLAPWVSFISLMFLAWAMPQDEWRGVAGLLAISAALFATGIGVGLIWPQLLSFVVVVAPDEQADLASASISTVQLFATAFGASCAAIIVNLVGAPDDNALGAPEAAARWLFAICALAPLASALPLSRSPLINTRGSQ